MDSAQQQMQAFLDELVASGHERGLQMAVYRDGELIVDAYAGIVDPATNKPVTGDTLFPVFSTTKGVAATLLHRLVQRGLLHYDMPIAEVWPGFAAHGKGGILVRHALNHTTGLHFMPMGIGYREMVDWDVMCAAIADLTPVSAPGEIFHYQAVTYSWLVGEVVRRVGGKSFGQLLASEITVPLGIADSMFVGIPDEVEPRVAVLEDEYARNSGVPIPDDSE
ncbi:MAG: serine hydrolase domain-containing protein, partial [bacterium]